MRHVNDHPNQPTIASEQDLAAIYDTLAARFPEGADISVPATWLVHLAPLDRALAAIEPNYTLAQVKEKFGTLRYYFNQPLDTECCAQRATTDPVPGDDTDLNSPTWQAWCDREDAHLTTTEHQKQTAAKKARWDQMDTLVTAAENASATW